MLKKGYFSSMEHFLREVEQTKFPNPEHQLEMRYNSRQQQANESVCDYWIEFGDLAEACDQDPMKSVIRFIEGIQDPTIHSQLRVKLTEVSGKDAESIKKLLVLADGMERYRQMEMIWKKKAASVAATSMTALALATVASTSASTQPKSKPKTPPPKPQKLQQPQQDAQPQQQPQQSQRVSPVARGRGGKRDRGGSYTLRQENEHLLAHVLALTGQQAASTTSMNSSTSKKPTEKEVLSEETQRRLRELAEC